MPEIDRRHPVVVVAQLLAVHLVDVELLPREGRDAHCRSDDDVVVLIDLLEAAEDPRLLGMRPGEVRERELGAEFVVRDDVRAEHLAVVGVEILVA